MEEGIVFSIIIVLLVLYKAWKNRKLIKEAYITGWNIMCHKAGMPPYIPKEKVRK